MPRLKQVQHIGWQTGLRNIIRAICKFVIIYQPPKEARGEEHFLNVRNSLFFFLSAVKLFMLKHYVIFEISKAKKY